MPFTEFTCRAGGSNLSAGTLDGVAQAAAAPLVTYTNGGWNGGTGVFTPASGNPTAAGVAVGQFVSVYPDGTVGATGFVARVTAVSATTFTLSTAAKFGTAPGTLAAGVTAVVGGAWKGPTGAIGFPMTAITSTCTNAAGNPPRVNYKNDQTYAVTATVTVANGGVVTHQGYAAAFGDQGRATLDGGTVGAAYHLLVMSNAQGSAWLDWQFQNNGASGTNDLMRNGLGLRLSRCVFAHSRGNGFNGSNSILVACEAFDCNQSNTANQAGFMGGAAGTLLVRCVAHDNAGANSFGFYVGFGASFVNCVAANNGAAGWKLDQNTVNQQSSLVRCVAYNNAADGITFGNNTQAVYLESVIFAQNAGYGVRDNSQSLVTMQACAFYLNGLGPVSSATGTTLNVGPITLTGDPFVAAAGADYRLNNTAGAGAACRAAGLGTFATGPTVSYPDVGAAQHADPVPPTAGNVRAGVVYNDGTATGTLALPAAGHVRAGDHYGAAGTEFTGAEVLPTPAQVTPGVGYGANGTEFIGAAVAPTDYPPVGDVEGGVIYGFGTLTGTFVVPVIGDVRAPVGYGANGTEFYGTLAVPPFDPAGIREPARRTVRADARPRG